VRVLGALAGLCLLTAPGPVLAQTYAADFALAVQRCWVIDVISEASDIAVTLAFSMRPDGTVGPGSVKMVSASAGSKAAIDQAFQSARRALLRCQGSDGYNLPVAEHAQWKDVEMSFDPHEWRRE